MPELPEVEVVRRGLDEHLHGRTIHRAEILHARTARRQPGGGPEFASRLAGRTIDRAHRRGKYLWLTTDDPGLCLAGHLGMSGQFRVDQAAMEHQHVRARLDLTGTTASFLDQRTFGWLAAVPLVRDGEGNDLIPPLVADIARDPFDPLFDSAEAARALRRRRIAVKTALLDQALVSGIGNIYADESLWRESIHPRRRTDTLSQVRARRLLLEAREVMAQALALGGTSFDALYVDVNGRSGYFSRGLAVYGRAGLPCSRCGAIIVRDVLQGRSCHFCPRCQRPPRAAD